MGCKESKRGTSFASLYSEAKPSEEGGAKRRMRVKTNAPLTRISSFRSAQAEIQPSPTRGEGKRAAFTLAEVLITLGIIGIIAAMTIPALVGKYKKEQIIQQAKKAYSVMAQAFNFAVSEYGDSTNWDVITPASAQSYFSIYWAPYLKAYRRCNSYTTCGYEKLTPFYKSNGRPDAYYVSVDAGAVSSRIPLYLNDGTFVMIINSSGYDPDDKRILVDLNGSKLPNRFGQDVFFFLRINGKGVVPYGYDQDETTVNEDCSLNGSGYMCFAKLVNDGWKMKNDYPF